MARKKQATINKGEAADQHGGAAIAEAEAPASLPPIERPAYIDGPPTPVNGVRIAQAEPAQNWGDPYKSIFSCKEMGFELGENRRFKQRIFLFGEKPTAAILAELKENGFTYRAAEKAWTLPANAETRKLTEDLARKWAGPNYIQSIER